MWDLKKGTGTRNICKTLQVSPKTLLEWIRERGFPAFRVDGRGPYRVVPQDYFCWLRKQSSVLKHR